MEDYTEVEVTNDDKVDLDKVCQENFVELSKVLLDKAEEDRTRVIEVQKALDSYTSYMLKSNQLALAKETAHQRFLQEKESHEADLKEAKKARWTSIGCTAAKCICGIIISCLAINREYQYEQGGETKVYNGSKKVDKMVDDLSRRMF